MTACGVLSTPLNNEQIPDALFSYFTHVGVFHFASDDERHTVTPSVYFTLRTQQVVSLPRAPQSGMFTTSLYGFRLGTPVKNTTL